VGQGLKINRMKINIFWFRRDLRLDDNTALYNALKADLPVLPVFVFDTNITEDIQSNDPRINFIYETLTSLNKELQKLGSSVYVVQGDPVTVWDKLMASFDINAVFINKDYEPYTVHRDNMIEALLMKKKIPLLRFKDQVIFEEREVIKSDNKPYTIFTPFKRQWLQKFRTEKKLNPVPGSKETQHFLAGNFNFPSPGELGIKKSHQKIRPFDLSVITNYDKFRDIPSEDRTSYLGPHLRFGTISIRKIVEIAVEKNALFLSELIWREFFMQILFNFPDVVTCNFKSKYDNILWRNNEEEFEKWCRGETGYPIVDAGMRQLNNTGYMHNRVRMITSGFLCKHLLIDWRWGEAYFAHKLLDYELSSNNGNWQWAAGTGCDAAPYFRVFNPDLQLKRFDPENKYAKKWIEELNHSSYPRPIVDHSFARERAISVYRSGLRFHS
jgi:deoxyribodipyrimidine photo-lyase